MLEGRGFFLLRPSSEVLSSGCLIATQINVSFTTFMYSRSQIRQLAWFLPRNECHLTSVKAVNVNLPLLLYYTQSAVVLHVYLIICFHENGVFQIIF